MKDLIIKFALLLAALLAVLAIAAFLYPPLLIGLIVYFPTESMKERSETTFVFMTQRHVADALNERVQRRLACPPGSPYWGPLNDSILKPLGIESRSIIDPFNRQPPKSQWKVLDELYSADRGGYVRIRGGEYQYYTNGAAYWFLLSPGPDGRYDISRETIVRLGNMSFEEGYRALQALRYDSTNGTASGGDIFRSANY